MSEPESGITGRWRSPKPRITRAEPGRWLLIRPAWGFGPLVSITAHASHAEALRCLRDRRVQGGGIGQYERADWLPMDLLRTGVPR